MTNKIILILMVLGISTFGDQSPQKRFRPVKLINADFSIPASTGVIGWNLQNKGYPGKFIIENDAENKDKYLKITPLPDKSKKIIRTLIFNTTAFKASVGNRIKISYQVRSPEGGKLGIILNHKNRNQWPAWKRETPKEWQTVTLEYAIKLSGKNDGKGDYYFGFDVFEKPVEIKNIKIAIYKTDLPKKEEGK